MDAEFVLGNYVALSAITVMIYDWALSFDDEVRFIWGEQWPAPKVLYLISRYYPIIYLSILYYVRNLTTVSAQLCWDYTWYHGFGGVICILPPVSAIFTLRVCALYSHTRWIVVLLWFLWLFETTGEVVTTVRVTIGEHKDNSIIYGPGCVTQTASDPALYRSELLAWVPALFGSLTLFTLTLYSLGYLFPAYFSSSNDNGVKPGKHNHMSFTFVKDGTIYFFFVFVATLLTMVSDLVPSLSFFNDWWHSWFILLYSISGSRLVLNLRRSNNVYSDIADLSVQQSLPLAFWNPSAEPSENSHYILQEEQGLPPPSYEA